MKTKTQVRTASAVALRRVAVVAAVLLTLCLVFMMPVGAADGNVAKIDNNEYATLKLAVDAANSDDVIVLINDIILDGAPVSPSKTGEITTGLLIDNGKSVTIDLNGFKISGNCNSGSASLIAVENGATLNIKDSSESETGKITYATGTSKTGFAISVYGNLTLNSGTIESTGTWSSSCTIDLRPNAWGTAYTKPVMFIMNGGKVTSSTNAIRIVSNSAQGHEDLGIYFTMNSGIIESARDAIFVQKYYDDHYHVTIKDGSISGSLSPIRLYDGANNIDITIEGGSFDYTGDGSITDWSIVNVLRGKAEDVNSAKIIISGGIFEGDVAEYVIDGYYAQPNADNTYTVKNTVTVSFDSDVESQTVPYNTKITKPEIPTKKDHTFLYWLNGETEWDFDNPVTGDMSLVAKWIANDYTISSSVDNVGFDSVKVGYTQPEAQTVTITNDGNVPVTVEATISEKYEVSLDKKELSAEGEDEKAIITIKPKAGLPVGNYEATLTINVVGTDKTLTIPVSFLVYQPSSGGSSTTKPEEPVEPEQPVEPETPTDEPVAGEPTVETEVTDGGEVLFEEPVAPETPGADTPSDEPAEPAEPAITGVVLPEGTDSEVAFIPVSEKPAPAGKETQTKKVFEINVPKYEKGKPATIKFTMTVAELAADGKTAADVALWHQDEETGEWTKLVTTFVIIDGVVYFEAITFDFSPFAIVYEDVSAPTEPETPEQPTESPAPILAVLAGLGAAIVLRRK